MRNRWLRTMSLSLLGAMLVLSGHQYAFAQQSTFERRTDRPGLDYRNFELAAPDPAACRSACLSAPECQAWTYVRPGVQGPKARCWLKSAVPRRGTSSCCVSGVVTGRPATDYSQLIESYSKEIQRDPASPSAYRNRAFAYERLGRKKNAIADYRKALLLEPADTGATAGLARLGAKPF
jgi:tetratricopeptide (TPR) repeat protein